MKKKKIQISPGDKYGRLTIIEETKQDKNYIRYFLCICDCGNYHTVSLSNLRSITGVSSCGCLRTENYSRRKKDVIGNKYGRLTIIEEKAQRGYLRKVLAICDCPK